MLHAADAPEVAARFGLGEPVSLTGPVDRGEVGEVWRLETAHGRYAVKAPFSPQDAGDLAEPAAFADAAAAAGVLTPRMLRSRRGALLEVCGGQQVAVLTWLDMAGPDPGLDPVSVGELLAALHRLQFAGTRPASRWYQAPVGARRWDELVAACATAGAPFAQALGEARDTLLALESLIDPLPVDGTCHRDLWSDNVRVTSDGRLGVFDWDNCGPASHDEELAAVLFEYGLGDRGRQRLIHDAYRAAGGTGRVSSLRACSMLIAQLGHIGEYQLARWLQSPAGAERERAERAVEEFLGLPPHRPLDRPAVEALVDAVA